MSTEQEQTSGALAPADRPLATIFFRNFNQKQFVEQSLESAFAQTYSPLEIRIFDDCSDDGSFEMIQRMVAAYRGPHDVHLVRNSQNIGPGQLRHHWNSIKGELVAIFDGDDVSAPDRIERQVQRLIDLDASLVACNAHIIDAQGRRKGLRIAPGQSVDNSLEPLCQRGFNPLVFGAGLLFRRELFDVFGPIEPPTRATDQILVFRATLLRGAQYMSEPLVSWRHHDRNRSHFLQKSRADPDKAEAMRVDERWLYSRVASRHAMLADLDAHLKRRPDDPRLPAMERGRQLLLQGLLKESRDWVTLRFEMIRNKVVMD